MMLDILTSCFSFLIEGQLLIFLFFSCDFSNDVSFLLTWKMRWSGLFFSDRFYVFIHFVFAPEKVLTKTLQFAFSFIILSPMTNVNFPFLSTFGLSFLCSSAAIVFGGLLWRLYNDLAIAMSLLAFLDISSSCFSFWFPFSSLWAYLGAFVFWFFLLSILELGSCLELLWFSEVFSVAFFCGKNTFLENVSFREFVILSLAWTCPCRNYFWSCSWEIFLSAEILLDLVAGKLFFWCYSFLQIWYCVYCHIIVSKMKNPFWNELISVINDSFSSSIKHFFSSFNVPMKLLL